MRLSKKLTVSKNVTFSLSTPLKTGKLKGFDFQNINASTPLSMTSERYLQDQSHLYNRL